MAVISCCILIPFFISQVISPLRQQSKSTKLLSHVVGGVSLNETKNKNKYIIHYLYFPDYAK